MILLSGDIGGTKTWLQLSEYKEGKLTSIATMHYISSDFNDAAVMTRQLLKDTQNTELKIDVASYAVAGPIVKGRAQLTNLPWDLDADELSDKLGIPRPQVYILNDFQAIGHGLDLIEPDQFYTLQEGSQDPNRIRAIIGAGTGLGVALCYPENGSYSVNPTEGGHVDFAPTDNTQIRLLKFLRKKYHRVSSERVASGLGLVNIFKFVRENPLYNETENRQLLLAMHREDPAAAISRFAIVENDPMAKRAVDIFVEIYGAQTGNLALMCLPYGGIYIVGGIAPKILDQLVSGNRFLRHYHDKGRMSRLLKQFSIRVVLDTQVGLKGAAMYAVKQQPLKAPSSP